MNSKKYQGIRNILRIRENSKEYEKIWCKTIRKNPKEIERMRGSLNIIRGNPTKSQKIPVILSDSSKFWQIFLHSFRFSLFLLGFLEFSWIVLNVFVFPSIFSYSLGLFRIVSNSSWFFSFLLNPLLFRFLPNSFGSFGIFADFQGFSKYFGYSRIFSNSWEFSPILLDYPILPAS